MTRNKDFVEQVHMQNKLLKINTMLWLAVKSNRSQKVKELLENGASLHKITGIALRRYDLEENTLLHIAAKNGFLDLIKLLVQHKMKVDVRNRLKQTPLQWACYYGHLPTVKYLVEKKADIHAIDTDGDPALTWAANQGQKKIVDYLISLGADPKKVNSIGNTALHWVAISGELNMAKHLIQLGCNPLLKNKAGATPLDLAIENAHPKIIKLFDKLSS